MNVLNFFYTGFQNHPDTQRCALMHDMIVAIECKEQIKYCRFVLLIYIMNIKI